MKILRTPSSRLLFTSTASSTAPYPQTGYTLRHAHFLPSAVYALVCSTHKKHQLYFYYPITSLIAETTNDQNLSRERHIRKSEAMDF